MLNAATARRTATGLAAGLALVALAACGDDDKDKGKSSEAKAETLTLTGSTAGKAAKLTGLPTEAVTGGAVPIRFTNDDAKSPMEAQFVRVDGSHSDEQVRKQVLDTPEGAPTPPWAHGAGGSGSTKPGQTSSSTLLLEPGNYYVQADADVDNGEVKAAVLPLTVEGDSGAKLPATDATISATEYAFQSSGLKAGKNTVLFDNKGAELHHVIALPIAKGKTIADVKKAFASEEEPQGPPPVDFEAGSGTSVLDGGTAQVAELELRQGRYAFVCFLSDRKGGPPHVVKGMVTEVDVP